MPDKEKEVLQWDNWLLEAVRKIRTQKQRPGLDRIYNAVRLLAEKQELAEHSQKSPISTIYHVQFNQIKIEQVQRHLDRAVRRGLLLKVYSKGQATYKSLEKSERTLNLVNNDAASSGELSKCLLKVIRELSECDASASSKPPKVGHTFDTIEEYLRHSHVVTNPDNCEPDFFQGLVRQAVAKECARGKLELVDGEYYRLPPQTTAPSSQGTSGKTSTSAAVSSASASSNSNSSCSSTSSTNTPAPTTFSGISPSVVTSKVKSASSSQGTTLIKTDSGGGAAVKQKEGSPSTATSSCSPPRGNLPGDLSEAEEIALVTEQTARAVMLVMKDRRPGEKPVASKRSTPPLPKPQSESISQADNTKNKTKSTSSVASNNSSSDDDSVAAKRTSPSVEENKSSSSGSCAANEESVVQPPPPPPKSSNGSNGNGKETAVIKLMVPSFPGRNGNGNNGHGNGNGTKNGTSSSAASSSGASTSTSDTPSKSSLPASAQKKEQEAMQASDKSSKSGESKPSKVKTGNDEIADGKPPPAQTGSTKAPDLMTISAKVTFTEVKVI